MRNRGIGEISGCRIVGLSETELVTVTREMIWIQDDQKFLHSGEISIKL